MEFDEQQGDNVDSTKHKTTYSGTPINHSKTVNRDPGYGSDKQEGLFPTNRRSPPQSAGIYNASPNQIPTILQQEDSESVSLPSVRRGNVFQQMMIAKHARFENKKKSHKKKAKKGHPILLEKPFPGITKIKSPISNAVNASTLTTSECSSPKRNRDTMEGKNDTEI